MGIIFAEFILEKPPAGNLPLRLLSFQLYHVDEKLSVFVLRASILECISSLGLDGRADMQPVKSGWLVLHGELKAGVLTPL